MVKRTEMPQKSIISTLLVYLPYLVVIMAVSGCKPCLTASDYLFLDQNERKTKKAGCEFEKLANQYPELIKAETITDSIQVFTESVKVDTLLLAADTIKVEKDNFFTEIIYLNDSILVTGGCETDTIFVPYEVECPPIFDTSKLEPRSITTLQQVVLYIGWASLFGFLFMLVLAALSSRRR